MINKDNCNINNKKVHFSKESPNIFEYEAFDQSNISYYCNDIFEDNLDNYEDIESIKFRLKLDKLDKTIHQISKVNSTKKFEQEISDIFLPILNRKKYYTDIIEIDNINLNNISDINDYNNIDIITKQATNYIKNKVEIKNSNSQIKDKWINLSDLSSQNFLSDNSEKNVNTNSTIIDLQSTSDSLCLL